jgi:hypothetical protein
MVVRVGHATKPCLSRRWSTKCEEVRRTRWGPINLRDYLTYGLLMGGVSDSRKLANSNAFRVKCAGCAGAICLWAGA